MGKYLKLYILTIAEYDYPIKIDDPDILPRTVDDIYKQFFSFSKDPIEEHNVKNVDWKFKENSYNYKFLLKEITKANEDREKLNNENYLFGNDEVYLGDDEYANNEYNTNNYLNNVQKKIEVKKPIIYNNLNEKETKNKTDARKIEQQNISHVEINNEPYIPNEFIDDIEEVNFAFNLPATQCPSDEIYFKTRFKPQHADFIIGNYFKI